MHLFLLLVKFNSIGSILYFDSECQFVMIVTYFFIIAVWILFRFYFFNIFSDIVPYFDKLCLGSWSEFSTWLLAINEFERLLLSEFRFELYAKNVLMIHVNYFDGSPV